MQFNNQAHWLQIDMK